MIKKTVFILFIFLSLSSCAVLDFPARFLGFSIQKFQDDKAAKFQSDFNFDKKAGFERTLLIIDALLARPTHKSFKKGYIIAFDFAKSFDFCLDSTEVGFFIKEIDEKKIEISVISNNSLLAKELSKKFFEMFGSTMTFVKEKEESDKEIQDQENPLRFIDDHLS
ncbi:MAG: hypothetical protein LBQ04_02060 [Endomicrobium sp.]|jgi:hypothetical protein|nr:hypothetical protein [Endomicrobium sp.]